MQRGARSLRSRARLALANVSVFQMKEKKNEARSLYRLTFSKSVSPQCTLHHEVLVFAHGNRRLSEGVYQGGILGLAYLEYMALCHVWLVISILSKLDCSRSSFLRKTLIGDFALQAAILVKGQIYNATRRPHPDTYETLTAARATSARS